MGRTKRKKAALATLAVVVTCAGLWVGIHRIPWLGPWLADTARAVVGPTAVARVEDVVYGIEDRVKRVWWGDKEPEPLWELPEAVASPCPSRAAPAPAPEVQDAPLVVVFQPAAVGPLLSGFSAPGDGTWTALPSRWQDELPRMFKTSLHPDRQRPWTAVAVVALDLRRIDVHLLAGVYVPEATEPGARGARRPALIPAEHQRDLIAAFNGGFKTIHGRLGMHVDGTTLIAPQPQGCTVGKLSDGRIDIGTWEPRFAGSEGLVWWRQAPTCLVEHGSFGRGVLVDDNVNWGTSVHGGTFIRRSAVGIDEDGGVLYVGMGDAVSARLMAMAMKHAGAHHVAQLDVNWTLPKFLTYAPRGADPERLEPTPLYEGLQHTRNEYVREPSPRDFFYVTRRAR
jgi:hypothetical protein